MIFSSFGSIRMIFSALEEVTQISVSAFTSALVLTYEITLYPECSALNLRRSSALQLSANEQPAFISGMSTFLSGQRIFIVSPIKCTPHITNISACTRVACCASARESPMKSAISCISGRV